MVAECIGDAPHYGLGGRALAPCNPLSMSILKNLDHGLARQWAIDRVVRGLAFGVVAHISPPAQILA